MIKYTNKFGLPDAFVRACVNDPYDRGDSDFTATSLAEPARASALKLKHADEIEVDVSTRVASIIGQGTHSIAERAARPGIDLCEERVFSEFIVQGIKYKVSAQLDLYESDSGALYDWKTTKAFAFSKAAGSGNKPEWRAQLNVGAEILRRNNINPKSINIIALLKDWNIRDAGKSHPESEVVLVELPMWTREESTKYIEDRITAHMNAINTLPECSKAENWAGRKCGQWCEVSKFCAQYQESLTTGILNK